MKPLRRVAVLGAGTMGARIAAHFANAGFPVDLLDIVLPDQPKRNWAALGGIENAAKQRPVAFFTDAAKTLITPGNFEDAMAAWRRCARRGRLSRRIPAGFRWRASPRASIASSGSISWARTSSIRRATCTWRR